MSPERARSGQDRSAARGGRRRVVKPRAQTLISRRSADQSACLASNLVNPATRFGVPISNSLQGTRPSPVDSECVLEPESGYYFCGIAGATCTTASNCDNGVCSGGQWCVSDLDGTWGCLRVLTRPRLFFSRWCVSSLALEASVTRARPRAAVRSRPTTASATCTARPPTFRFREVSPHAVASAPVRPLLYQAIAIPPIRGVLTLPRPHRLPGLHRSVRHQQRDAGRRAEQLLLRERLLRLHRQLRHARHHCRR